MNLIKIIENALLSMIDSPEYQPPIKFWASDSGLCLLYRYWKRKDLENGNYEVVKDIKAFWRFQNGIFGHILIKKALENAGYVKASEIVLESKHIKGRADLLLESDNKNILIELKTAKSLKYIEQAPKIEHILQATTYYILFLENNIKIDEVYIIYAKTPDYELKIHKIDPTLYIEAVKSEYEALIKAYENGIEPEPKPDWFCDYCPYNAICPFAKLE